jgi:hypothetical protein
MKPTVHVLSTIFAYILVTLFYPLSLNVLFWAVFLTLFVDLADHGFFVLTLKNPTSKEIRILLKQCRFQEAYMLYYDNRRKILTYALLHNLPVLTLVLVLTAYYRSPTLGLGLVPHYALDIIDHYNHEGNLNFWLRKKTRP